MNVPVLPPGRGRSYGARGPACLIVHPHRRAPRGDNGSGRDAEARLAEAVRLAQAINLDVRHAEVVNLGRPVPATLFGRGTVERIGRLVWPGRAGESSCEGTPTGVTRASKDAPLPGRAGESPRASKDAPLPGRAGESSCEGTPTGVTRASKDAALPGRDAKPDGAKKPDAQKSAKEIRQERRHAPHDEPAIAVAVVDAPLTPVQQRNLERAWSCKVIDRTGLILEIFGSRARTREGQMQVELAALTYQRSRLVRSWTHLERQRGGFGFLGGPGETQIETDRRLIGERIVRLKRELDDVKRTRNLHRAARKRVPYPVVALVGYTNAGKSTLFNAITHADVTARDQLFATLDPTMRGLELPSGRTAILSDTVGFISDLPHELVNAFHATLEEVREADALVHVRDAAHGESEAQKHDVLAVLKEIGREGGVGGKEPESDIIEALNKIDLLQPEARAALRARLERANAAGVAVSAVTGEGIPELLALVDRKLSASRALDDITLAPQDGADLAWLYAHGEVVERHDSDDAIRLKVRLDPEHAQRFRRRRRLQ